MGPPPGFQCVTPGVGAGKKKRGGGGVLHQFCLRETHAKGFAAAAIRTRGLIFQMPFLARPDKRQKAVGLTFFGALFLLPAKKKAAAAPGAWSKNTPRGAVAETRWPKGRCSSVKKFRPPRGQKGALSPRPRPKLKLKSSYFWHPATQNRECSCVVLDSPLAHRK